MKIEKGMKVGVENATGRGTVMAVVDGVFFVGWEIYRNEPVAYFVDRPPSWMKFVQPESPNDIVHEFTDVDGDLWQVRDDGKARGNAPSFHTAYWGPAMARLALRVKELEAQLAAVKP